MDINLINSENILNKQVELHGWLVDTADGLFLFGYHMPRDYNYPHNLQLLNKNMIYPVMRKVATYVGGKSSLFHEAKLIFQKNIFEKGIYVDCLFVKPSLKDPYIEIDISQTIIDDFVKEFGDYVFKENKRIVDWLDETS